MTMNENEKVYEAAINAEKAHFAAQMLWEAITDCDEPWKAWHGIKSMTNLINIVTDYTSQVNDQLNAVLEDDSSEKPGKKEKNQINNLLEDADEQVLRAVIAYLKGRLGLSQ